ncbi:MAG: hypothetical protein ABIH34_06350 [Nanoarchaeota archaeon]
MKAKLGPWAFVIGLVLALLVAVFSASSPPTWAVFVLAVLGVVVGLMNVTQKETQTFLIATIAFLLSFNVLSAVFTTLTFGWTAVASFFDLMSVFVVPAAAIVAIKALFSVAKD